MHLLHQTSELEQIISILCHTQMMHTHYWIAFSAGAIDQWCRCVLLVCTGWRLSITEVKIVMATLQNGEVTDISTWESAAASHWDLFYTLAGAIHHQSLTTRVKIRFLLSWNHWTINFHASQDLHPKSSHFKNLYHEARIRSSQKYCTVGINEVFTVIVKLQEWSSLIMFLYIWS